MAGPLALILPVVLPRILDRVLDRVVPDLAPAARQQAKVDLVAELALEPEVQHATNAEPWYRSNVTLGSIQAILAGAAAIAGALKGGQIDLAVIGPALWSMFGAAQALYGRWKARRPIGA